MKTKKDYLLKEIAGEAIVVPIRSAAKEFSGVIKLNELGAFLWKKLETDASEDELLESLLEEYDVEPERAKADISAFLERLRENHLLCED